MSLHIGRRRLGTATATVLAVTLGVGSLLALPAGATAAPAKTQQSGGLLPMVPGARLLAAGTEGFLTSLPHAADEGKIRWTPYDGGAGRDVLYDVVEGIAETSGDTVVSSSDAFGTKAEDMSTGTSFGMQAVPDILDSFYGGLAGSDLFVSGESKLWLEAGDTGPRAVQGLPEHATFARVKPGTPPTACSACPPRAARSASASST